MSNALYPDLPGLTFSVKRSPEFKTIQTQAVSGKESRIALASAPLWHYELVYEFLRADAAYAELQSLLGFYLQRQGCFDSFLFRDPDDGAVVGQGLGQGDGATTTFAVVRALGGFVEPVIVDVGRPVRWTVDGVAAPVTYDDATAPSTLAFAAAPAAGAVIKGDFSYLFRLRFDEDQVDFEKFMAGLWEAKSIKLVSAR